MENIDIIVEDRVIEVTVDGGRGPQGINTGKPWVKVGDTSAIPLVTDEILHAGKVSIENTLKLIANYDVENQTIFNTWDHNSQDTPTLPLFTFTGGEFPNPNPLTQPNNYVYNFGINLNSGGGNLDGTKASIGVGFETEFYIDGLAYSEWHVLASDKNNVKQRRPITIITAHDGSRNDLTNFVSNYHLHDKDGTKQIYKIDTNTEEWSYNSGNQLKHIFRTANYQPIWQNNGSGTSFPLIGYLTGRLQLGNPTDNLISRLGQSFEFGHTSGYDFIGSALGNGAINLKLGIDGKKYNTVEINSNFEGALKLTVPSNLNGWGHGITANGYYFYDYTNSRAILEMRNDRVAAYAPVNLANTYPTDGTGVPIGSLFRATTGALYYKGTSGTVTLIANS